MPMKDAKASNPVELAEFAISRKVHKEPAFAWWIPTVMKKKRIISKVKNNRRHRKTMKFGVKIPMNLDEALRFDEMNGNDLWSKSTDKEIKNVRVAFEMLNDGEDVPIGSTLINYHIIFDVKMDLTRKARIVAGGRLSKEVPRYMSYSSVVDRDSVRIGFLLASLNDLDIMAADVGNAYLNAKPRDTN